MRLIDADKLIDILNNKYLVVGAEGNPKDSVARNERLYEDIMIINSQPTAYDVEKVIKDLEDVRSVFDELIINEDRKDCIQFVNGINQALVIVRKGGAE